jgi:hypothetical protein
MKDFSIFSNAYQISKITKHPKNYVKIQVLYRNLTTITTTNT